MKKCWSWWRSFQRTKTKHWPGPSEGLILTVVRAGGLSELSAGINWLGFTIIEDLSVTFSQTKPDIFHTQLGNTKWRNLLDYVTMCQSVDRKVFGPDKVVSHSDPSLIKLFRFPHQLSTKTNNNKKMGGSRSHFPDLCWLWRKSINSICKQMGPELAISVSITENWKWDAGLLTDLKRKLTLYDDSALLRWVVETWNIPGHGRVWYKPFIIITTLCNVRSS